MKKVSKFPESLWRILVVDLSEDQKTKIMSLSGVQQYPMRVKCATLAWHTLTSAIDGKEKTINTEINDI
mgnify:CR=1 FL=1